MEIPLPPLEEIAPDTVPPVIETVLLELLTPPAILVFDVVTLQHSDVTPLATDPPEREIEPLDAATLPPKTVPLVEVTPLLAVTFPEMEPPEVVSVPSLITPPLTVVPVREIDPESLETPP
ncbi:hypothetical protein [Propionivibrio limicola]|uniref:hypothetical protein n=1 Tax=Propionivibrio limicola TaxID=167645 RepID=UPI00129139F3|nr:hypothetical protein [Propionivibrio limicola]